MMTMLCPLCNQDISETDATSDSSVSGCLDRSFECVNCIITVYTHLVEKKTNTERSSENFPSDFIQKRFCNACGEDISENHVSAPSEVSGLTDLLYECHNCKTDNYVRKFVYGVSD